MALTLKEVQAFPLLYEIDPIGFHFWFLLLPVALFVILYFPKEPERKSFGLTSLTIIFVAALISLAFITLVSEYPTRDSIQAYEAHHKEWVAEYAEPFIANLPVKKADNLLEVDYDYLTAEQEEAPSEGLVPLKIVDKHGKTEKHWATIVFQEDPTSSYMLYQELTEDLRFEPPGTRAQLGEKPIYEAGIYNSVFYTGDKKFAKYLTQE